MKKSYYTALSVAIMILVNAFTTLSSFALDEITNKEKAVAVIKGIQTGDPKALDYISSEQYIQHNSHSPDGKVAIAGYFTGKPTGFEITIHRVLADGMYVAVQSTYSGKWNNGKPQVAFDVFRFRDGLIVEHWDNLQDVMPPNPSGNTEVDGATKITDLKNTNYNKQFGAIFMETLLIKGNFKRIGEFIKGNNYIQHNPGTANGVTGLIARGKERQKEGKPLVYKQIHKVIGEGNFVLVLGSGLIGKTKNAFYDLLRIKDGFVVEHWDVIQEIPPKSEWKNGNGKF